MTLPVWFGPSIEHDGEGRGTPESTAERRLHVVRDRAEGAPDAPDQATGDAVFARAVDGDFDAFEALHGMYYHGLLRFAHRFVTSRDDAEDVVQHVFVTLWVHRANVARNVAAGPYLFGATRNKALTHRARFGRRDTVLALEERSRSANLERADPSAARATAECDLRATLDRAIAQIPERQRAALVLWWVEEMSYADVGRALGVSAVAARKLVGKGLERLRPLLDL